MIGAGPGGYVAGIRLGQLKKKTLVVERDKPGGICLNVGCIPSKALINASKILDKIRHGGDIGILADNAARRHGEDAAVEGRGRLQADRRREDPAQGQRHRLPDRHGALRLAQHRRADRARQQRRHEGAHQADNIIIATGSRPIEIPGFKFDGKRIVDSTGALDFAAVPERFVVIGGGYIGIEIGTLYAKLGSKVTVVEALPGILAGNDPEIVQLVARKLKKLGVEVMTGAKAKSWTENGGRAARDRRRRRRRREVTDDRGRQGSRGGRAAVRTPKGLGLEEIGVKIEHGFVPVDRQLRTNVAGIYAIGDVAGQPMLAHKASHEAEVVAEVIAGHRPRWTSAASRPSSSATRRSPPPASPPTRPEARRARSRSASSPSSALGRAIANADTDGFVKVVIDAADEGGARHPRRRQRRLRRHRRGGARDRDGRARRRHRSDDPRPPDAAGGDHGGRQGKPRRSDPYCRIGDPNSDEASPPHRSRHS